MLCLLPVWLPGPFVTLDGPVHLYNSRLIRNLFLDDELVKQFYRWNTIPEPNWTGHLFLAVTGFVFSSGTALKLLMSGIIVLTASGYRNLIIQSSSNQAWSSWLIFPWLYSFPFLLGFFNYSIGVALFPWFIILWMKDQELQTARNFSLLFILALLIYFSHIVVFGLAVIAAACISIRQLNREIRLLRLIFLSAPFVLLAIVFVFHSGTKGMHDDYSRLPLTEQLLNFGCARPLLIYDFEKELPTGFAYASIFLILIGIAIHQKTVNRYFRPVLGFVIIVTGLHFVLPDSIASGGILTVRLAQCSFLALIWLFACTNPSYMLRRLAAGISVGFTLMFFSMHHDTNRNLSAEASTYIDAASHIPSGSVVLPLNYSTNWLHANFCGFAGAEQHLIMLDNYEANQEHFPLLWQKGFNPETTYGNFASSNKPCVNLNDVRKPDAIITWQMPDNVNDSCQQKLTNDLAAYYKLTYQNTNAKVFLLKEYKR